MTFVIKQGPVKRFELIPNEKIRIVFYIHYPIYSYISKEQVLPDEVNKILDKIELGVNVLANLNHKRQ